MNVYLRRRLLLGSSLVILALTALTGCAKKEKEEDGPAIDWDSPRMRELEGEWNSLRLLTSHDLDKGSRFDMLVDRLFRTRVSARRLRELAASSKLALIPDDHDSFVDSILAYMAKSFVESGDRQSLVELLAMRCPYLIDGPKTIECFLAVRGWRLNDPILVLGEAYAKCRVPETRHALAASARRGFADLGIRGKDDEEFVNNAMRWYEKEKGHLIANDLYFMNEMTPGGITLADSYEKYPGLYVNPPPTREPLFRNLLEGPKNLGEDPDR